MFKTTPPYVKLSFFTRKCTIVRKVFDSHMKKQIILQLKNTGLITSFLNIQVLVQSSTSSHAVFWEVRTQWTVQKDIHVLLWLLNCLFYTNSIHPWACFSEPLILKMCPYPETQTRGVVFILRNAQNGLEHNGFACEFS